MNFASQAAAQKLREFKCGDCGGDIVQIKQQQRKGSKKSIPKSSTKCKRKIEEEMEDEEERNESDVSADEKQEEEENGEEEEEAEEENGEEQKDEEASEEEQKENEKSAYEQERLRRIEENAKFLESLGLLETKKQIAPSKHANKATKKGDRMASNCMGKDDEWTNGDESFDGAEGNISMSLIMTLVCVFHSLIHVMVDMARHALIPVRKSRRLMNEPALDFEEIKV